MNDLGISEQCREAVESIRQKIVRISQVQKPRILLVEDNQFDAELLKHQLEAQCVPCEIDISPTCEGALQSIRSALYDLVFVDLKFPSGMGGTELLKQVGNETDRITFIAISGLGDDEPPMKEAMKAGAAAIFTKPFTNRQLQGICGMMAATT